MYKCQGNLVYFFGMILLEFSIFPQVYWVGPILGGIAAALLYTHAFTAPTPSVRIIERYTAVQQGDEKEVCALQYRTRVDL